MAQTYDPSEVNVIVGGRFIEGFAEGSFVTAQMNSQLWTYHRGRGPGGGARTKNPNLNGVVSFFLLQTSPSNNWLQAFVNDARLGSGDAFSVYILNSKGGEEVRADSAWIINEPQLAMSKPGLETRQWTVESGNLRIFTRSDYPNAQVDLSGAFPAIQPRVF